MQSHRAVRFVFSFLASIFLSLLVLSCSDDGGSGPGTAEADYFPFGREYRWIYTSNIMAEKGTPVFDFEMKIDTATSWNGPVNRGRFWYWMIRDAEGLYPWAGFMGLKDSANVIYTLGDHPPEVVYPLFKHVYAADEGVRETITIQGTTYDAIRIELELGDVTISYWFAPNIGLIKEYSEQGGSLITDDQWGDDVIMNTELVSFRKIE